MRKSLGIILILSMVSEIALSQYQIINYATYNTGSNSIGSNTVNSIIENPATGEIFFQFDNGVFKYDGSAFSEVHLPTPFEYLYDVCFEFDQNGNIWYVVSDSVYKFDWVNYYSYPSPYASGQFYDILCDSNGNVWFAGNYGIMMFDGNIFTLYSTSNGLLSDIINCLFEDSNGDIWAGCGMGLNKFDGGNWIQINSSTGFSWINGFCNVSDIIEDSSGKLWIAGREIGYFVGDIWTLLDPTTLLNSSQTIQNIYSISIDNSGTIWFATGISGIFYFDGNNWLRFTENEGLPQNRINDICADSQERLWISMNSAGVCYLQDTSLVCFNTSDGLTENKVIDLFSDNDTLWVATSHGLCRNTPNGWESWFTGYSEGVNGGMNYDFDGNICLFGNNGQFYRYINNDWNTLMFYGGDAGDFISFESGHYWKVGGYGVMHFWEPFQFPQDWTLYNDTCGLPHYWCNCIERDPTDRIWVGTYDGIAMYMYPGFVEVIPPSTDFGNHIFDIRFDWDNNIWFASNNGVAKYSGSTTWEFFYEADGLPDNYVVDIEISSDSTIWFATNNGLSALTDSGFISITSTDGLASNWTYSVEEDNNHNLWVGTVLGLSKIVGICQSSTSINEIDNTKEISIYPNPTNDNFIIQNLEGNEFIKVYTISGQQLFSFNSKGCQEKVDISNYKPGIYFVTIIGKDFSKTLKVFKR